jgi:predicted MFS family arabinose efflux permease
LLLVDFADEWFSYLPAAALPSIRAELGLDYAQAGLLLALLGAGCLLGSGFTVAADFVGRRKLAAGGALAYAGCLGVFAVADTFLALAIAAFVWGAASDAFVDGATLALADLAGDDLDSTLARTNLLGSVGTLLAPFSVAVAAGLGIDWRALFAAAAIAMTAYAGCLAVTQFPRQHVRDHTPWSAIRDTARDRRVWRLGLVAALWDAIDIPFLGFVTAYLVSARGLSAASAASAVGTWTIGALVGFAIIAARPPRSETRALRSATVLRVLSVAGLLVASTPVTIAASAVVCGVSGAWFWVPFQATVLRLRPGQEGTTWAVLSVVALPGLAVPPLIGILADRAGAEAALAAYGALPVVLLLVLARPVRGLRRLTNRWKSSSLRSSDISAGRSRRPIS